MARLPSRDDLQRRIPTATSGGVSIPRANLSGFQRGAQALASGVASLADSIEAQQRQDEEFETRKNLLEFQLDQENKFEELRRNMPAGGAEFASQYRAQFLKDARKFVGKGDENLPERQRGAVGLKLKQIETSLLDRAHTLERAERDRAHVEGLENTLGKAVSSVGQDPANYQARLREGQELVEASKLPPEDRAKLRTKYGKELDRTAIAARIERARTAEDFERIKADLGIGPVPQGAERSSQLIVNSEARRDAQGRIQVYQIPAGDGGGRFEVAGINERYHPEAASKLAQMVRAGRHAEAEAYARQYITRYTQRSADLVEGDAAQYLVRDMAFNRGAGGANAALRMAIGIRPGSKRDAHRNLTAEERARVAEMARENPEQFVRAFSQARADYEYTFVGRREQFDAGLRRRWSDAQRNALRMLNGEMPSEAAEGSAFQPAYGNLDFKERDEFWGRAQAFRKKLVDEVGKQITALEDSAAVGKVFSPEIMGEISARIGELQDPALAARYVRTVGLAATIQDMHRRSVEDNQAFINSEIARLPTPTPEQREQIETLKKVVAGQKAMLGDDALTWAHRTGGANIAVEQLNPSGPTFVEQLQNRVRQAITVAQTYGITPQYFTKAERAALGDFLQRGGPGMVQFLGQLNNGFGIALGEAIKELAPKQPELARAGMLVAYGGDPQAVQDIATTLQRRADPNYLGPPKKDPARMVPVESQVFGDFYERMNASDRDNVIKSALAIYEARTDDRSDFDAQLYKEALQAAVGQRTVGDHSYGGIVPTRTNMLGWSAAGGEIMLPPNVRRDGWRALFDSISEDDLREAGLSLPVDGNGQPISITKVVNARIAQVAPNVYRFAMGDPTGQNEPPRWVMAGGPLGARGSFRSAQDAGVPNITTPFELDFNKLGPVLQQRLSNYFLKSE